MKFYADTDGRQRMNPTDSGDPLSFPLGMDAICPHLLEGRLQNLVHTFMFPLL